MLSEASADRLVSRDPSVPQEPVSCSFQPVTAFRQRGIQPTYDAEALVGAIFGPLPGQSQSADDVAIAAAAVHVSAESIANMEGRSRELVGQCTSADSDT